MAFDLPAQAGLLRDAAILVHVQAGDYELGWGTIQSQADGHQGQFRVFLDGLKIGGVRISASANVCQQIADLLGCTLLTPKLNDLCWLQAAIQIAPQTIYPPSDDTATMVKESQLIDAAIGNATGLVAPIGKPWCLSNFLVNRPGKACLYGWQSAQPIPNVPLHAGVTSGVQLIQPISTVHAQTYTDYAMLVSLVSRNCIVDGASADLTAVMQDPMLSVLVSHEGPLKITRQPGVPMLQGPIQPASYVQEGPVAVGQPRKRSLVGGSVALGLAGLFGGLAVLSD